MHEMYELVVMGRALWLGGYLLYGGAGPRTIGKGCMG